MLGRPEPNEAASYYDGYINRVTSDDVISVLENQLEETVAFLGGISEVQSLHRYGPDKWSMRQLLNHVNDGERIFLFRALWFARGFPNPLPGYEQDIGVAGAGADDVSWSAQVEEFRSVRLATLAFLRNLPADAWLRSGVANDSPATVRAIAYIIAGHVAHHTAILRERYL
ncbi:MAG: DinB family protein [Pyrinomonadaceae bacterium]|nr:DinB family protein [Pyrinomonadaceae bacterium]